jgi:predicted permease
VLAWWGGSLLVLMASAGPEPLPLDVTPDARALGFTLLVSLLSAVVFGTAPALRVSRTEANAALKGGKGAAQATRQSPLGRVLVVAQVALSLVLLVGAGLLVRTLVNLQNVPTGFDRQNVLVFKTDTVATGYKGGQLTQLLREVEGKVKALPGVRAAAFSFMIFNQGQWTSVAYTRDEPAPDRESRLFRNNVVGPDYFDALGIPLVQGRGFGPQDTDKSQKVAVISEEMAARIFPNRSPLGQRFGRTSKDPERFEVVGVVKDAKYGSLTERPRPMAYYPYEQQEEFLNNFVVRAGGAPEAVVPLVRRAISEVNRDLPVDEVATLAEHVDRSLVQQRLIARVASFFGLLALVLACVGLYGTMSYAVGRRINEIGIRTALGAQSRDVLWLILREALLLVAVGVFAGLAASLAATRAASALLYGLGPNDPLTFASATLLLLAVAALAGYLPARRAAKVDPMAALRYE